MKRILILIMTGLFVMALSAGAAWADPGNAQKEKGKAKGKAMQQLKVEYKALVQSGKADGAKFKDVKENHWANGSIKRMAALGLFAGYEDGTFKPNKNINQQETVALIMRLHDGANKNDRQLNVVEEDTEISPWALNAVNEAVYSEIVNINRFHSQVQASRLQACVWVAKALELNGELEVKDINEEDLESLPFNDLYITSEDLAYIVALYDAGYIAGGPGGKFNPNSAITRAEMAAILERLLKDKKVDELDKLDEYGQAPIFKVGKGLQKKIAENDDVVIEDGDVNAVEEDLTGNKPDVGDMEFEIAWIDYDEDNNEIMVELKTNDDVTSVQWDDPLIMGDVISICEIIVDAFQDIAAEPEMIYIDLYDEDYDVNSDPLVSYEYDVDYETLTEI